VRRRVLGGITIALASWLGGACAALVDVDPYVGRPAPDDATTTQIEGGVIVGADGALLCEPGKKLCQADCVAFDDPSFGCARSGCEPCAIPANGAARCTDAGRCSYTCPADLLDCDGGCIQRNAQNCAGCGQPCADGGKCSAGACLSACPQGTTECAGTCVDTSTSIANCGSCGKVCVPGQYMNAACDQGTCRYTCQFSNVSDCNGDAADGCECTGAHSKCSRIDSTKCCKALGEFCNSSLECCTTNASCQAKGAGCCMPAYTSCLRNTDCCSGKCLTSTWAGYRCL
jgi:hypothetical protein